MNPKDNSEIRAAFEAEIKLEGLPGALAAERVVQDKSDELRTLTNETVQR